MNSGTSLSLKGAEFRYPGAAENTLRGLELEIRAGEWAAVLGSNGSGKSTLMKLFNALLVPTQGICFVDGRPTSDKDVDFFVRSKVSLVFQNPEDQITSAVVEEDTAFGPENLGLAPEVIRVRVKDALTSVGLWEKRRAPVSSLSGGQKQRLALAGAIAMQPQCLLLDEAMSMLDPSARGEFIKIIRRQHEIGMTIVQVTHRLEEMADADSAVVLDRGSIIWRGTPRELFSLPDAELERMSLEKPPAAKLRDSLAASGLISPDTRPCAENISEALLCR